MLEKCYHNWCPVSDLGIWWLCSIAYIWSCETKFEVWKGYRIVNPTCTMISSSSPMNNQEFYFSPQTMKVLTWSSLQVPTSPWLNGLSKFQKKIQKLKLCISKHTFRRNLMIILQFESITFEISYNIQFTFGTSLIDTKAGAGVCKPYHISCMIVLIKLNVKVHCHFLAG